MTHFRLPIFMIAFALAAVAAAQQPPTPQPAPSQPAPSQNPFDTGGPPTTPRTRPAGPQAPELKPYKEVITDQAKTQEGMFKVHKIDEKIYWEIPTALLGRDFLWQTEVAETPAGLAHIALALGTRVVQFERHDRKIFMRAPNFSMRAEGSGALETGVEAANLSPIIASFNVLAESPEKSPVIEVTNVFLNDQSEFSVGPKLGAAGIDPTRSYIDRVTAFPTNIETRAYLTLGIGPSANATPTRGNRTPSSATILVDSSIVMLPEKPMMGRFGDSRVGFFATGFNVFGSPKHEVDTREFIERFRLEKKDPSAPISDPVNPITFYVSREVPEVYRPYIKKAIESWQPAFEQAGFSHAIIAKDAPTLKEDPTWSPEDARYSVIRWVPTTVANAIGPHIVDPRSGETISAHVLVYHNVLKLIEGWYFSQASAIDPRAQKLPLRDDVMGEAVQYAVTHEVGHTLGLEHNFKASSFYTIKALRDASFVKENGLAASIMDYTRFNYVAQPGDGAMPIGKIGPYDKFAIEWGYKPIPGAQKPEDEKVALDLIASRQVTHPELRSDADIANILGIDPTAQTEDMSNDALEAGRLGLLNIKRIAKNLVNASTTYGEDYTLLSDAYAALLTQRATELGHVVRLVGGVVTTDYHGGRGQDMFKPVPAERQAQAVKFLMASLNFPSELMSPEILNKVIPAGESQIVSRMNGIILNGLFSGARARRMIDNEAVNGKSAYTLAQMVSDVQNGVWSELSAPKLTIDPYRRATQRSYLDIMDQRINGDGSTGSDLKGIARHDLKALAKQIDKAIPKAGNQATVVHLEDSRRQIEKILEGKNDQSSATASALSALFGVSESQGYDCWSDPVGDEIRQMIKELSGR